MRRAAQSAADKSRARAEVERLEVAAIAAVKLTEANRKLQAERDRARATNRRLLAEQSERANSSALQASAREVALETELHALQVKSVQMTTVASADARVQRKELQALTVKLQLAADVHDARRQDHAIDAHAWKKATASELADQKKAHASSLVAFEARLAAADMVAIGRIRNLESDMRDLEIKLDEIYEHARVDGADYDRLAPIFNSG